MIELLLAAQLVAAQAPLLSTCVTTTDAMGRSVCFPPEPEQAPPFILPCLIAEQGAPCITLDDEGNAVTTAPDPIGKNVKMMPQWSHGFWMHLLVASSMILHAVDISTTTYLYGCNPAQFRELNPVLRPFAGGAVSLTLAKFGLAVGWNWFLLAKHENFPKQMLVLGLPQLPAIGYIGWRNASMIPTCRGAQ